MASAGTVYHRPPGRPSITRQSGSGEDLPHPTRSVGRIPDHHHQATGCHCGGAGPPPCDAKATPLVVAGLRPLCHQAHGQRMSAESAATAPEAHRAHSESALPGIGLDGG